MNIVEKIREAGVVGAGGAGFPTHIKVNCKAEYVIANGAECEPLLRVDQQLMEFEAQKVVLGVYAVMQQTGAQKGVIALKGHYKNAISALTRELKPGMSLHIMRGYYPAGDEQQIVYEVTGKVVPTGGLPLDVGAVVCNVSTLIEIANALEGGSVTTKYVTVGGAVATPKTFLVPIGTNAQRLIDAAGGTTTDCVYIIGGPCMGAVVENLDFPITKTTGGLLAIPKGHSIVEKKSAEMNVKLIKAVCCQCSMCTQMCPRNALGLRVEPHKAMRAVANGIDVLGDSFNGIFSCCDCGICTYQACNFGLKPSKVMGEFKKEFMKAGIKPKKEVYTTVDRGIEQKKLPVSRLVHRLGIAQYDVAAPINQILMQVESVKIPLKMHIGAPSTPVVSVGDSVSAGQLIAKIKENALGANIHASIGGQVVGVSEQTIEIRGGR